jgi:hypothetical protein
MTWRGEKSCPFRDLNSDLSAIQPVASCNDSINTFLSDWLGKQVPGATGLFRTAGIETLVFFAGF